MHNTTYLNLLFVSFSMQQKNVCPKHIIFPTYLRHQVSTLLSQRLAKLPEPVFDSKAIEFCARKVANGTGDMRRALEAASCAVDILVKEVSQGAKTEPSIKVGMRQMAAALSRVAGGIGSGNEHVASIKLLPVPQQLIMCAVAALAGEHTEARGLKAATSAPKLLGMTNSDHYSGPFSEAKIRRYSTDAERKPKSRLNTATLGELEASYGVLCKRIGVDRYTTMEFTTAIDVLCTHGLIRLTKSGHMNDPRRQKVDLLVAEDDVYMVLIGVPVLKDILKT